MSWQGILGIAFILLVLFGGYYLFLRYSRAKSRVLRQPGAVITKIYKDQFHFEEEARRMLEGGYAITYISYRGKYILTEGLSLEQIKANLVKIWDGKGFIIVSYSK
jgi:type VI protein secretion system component VasF